MVAVSPSGSRKLLKTTDTPSVSVLEVSSPSDDTITMNSAATLLNQFNSQSLNEAVVVDCIYTILGQLTCQLVLNV